MTASECDRLAERGSAGDRVLNWVRVTLAMATVLWGTTVHSESVRPRRIVSMDLCLDPVLVELVPHEHILALSQYSRDPRRSTIAAVATNRPYTNETAEEIVALEPDLVIASRHSAIATRNALQRVGIRFELFGVPQTIQESLAQIRQLASLLRRQDQGEALIATIEKAIAQARPAPGQRPVTAVVYQPGGETVGAVTVMDELMRVAGLDNMATHYGVTDFRPLSLELLINEPPEILLVGDTTYGAPTHAERLVHHPALRALHFRMTRERFPARLLYCAGPTMIHTLNALVAAREHRTRATTASASE